MVLVFASWAMISRASWSCEGPELYDLPSQQGQLPAVAVALEYKLKQGHGDLAFHYLFARNEDSLISCTPLMISGLKALLLFLHGFAAQGDKKNHSQPNPRERNSWPIFFFLFFLFRVLYKKHENSPCYSEYDPDARTGWCSFLNNTWTDYLLWSKIFPWFPLRFESIGCS